MNQSATRMSVCVKGPCAWVKVEGRADFHVSEVLKKLVHSLVREGCAQLLLEFTHCLLMDSTFAGTLSRLGRDYAQAQNDHPQLSLGLLNANPRILDTLANLGVSHLFQLLQQSTPQAKEFKVVARGTGQPDRKALTRNMLDAHCALVEINPANFETFKEVLKFLEEKLKTMEDESPGGQPQAEA